MTRIISEELNKKLKREYKLRFFSILFFSLSFILVINIFLVSPSYLLLSLYEKAYTLNNYSSDHENKTKMLDEFNKKLLQVYELSRKVPQNTKGVNTNITHILFDYAGGAITLNSIELLDETASTKVTIRGLATTRDLLLQFQNVIKQDTRFADFNIPIETLAKQKDLNFNVTFNYHEN